MIFRLLVTKAAGPVGFAGGVAAGGVVTGGVVAGGVVAGGVVAGGVVAGGVVAGGVVAGGVVAGGLPQATGISNTPISRMETNLVMRIRTPFRQACPDHPQILHHLSRKSIP